MAWIYILIAALFETAWTYCVKFLKFGDFKLLTWLNFYSPLGIGIMGPLAGYLLFGLANVYFFSLAIKQVPTATAFAAWTGASLVLIKLADTLFFHQSISWPEIFFMMLIMCGIMGLKFYAV